MDDPKIIAQYYMELLKALKSTKDEMGEDSPRISFQGTSLDEKIEESEGFLLVNSNPLGVYEGLSLAGNDLRIYSYDDGGLKILINEGSIDENKTFYTKLTKYVTFPLIIEDQIGSPPITVNQREDS